MAESEVRYCTTEDGVSIAYSVTGQGPSLLLMQPGPSHLELVWRTPRYTDLLEWLSRENSLILPDPRGCGMSQREGFDIDFDLDYAAVVSAVGVDRLILFAMSGGGPNAIRFAATRPELVERLVLWNTWAATATNLRDPRIGAILPMVSTDWVTFTEALVAALSGWREPEAARAYAAMMREAITQSAWLRAMEVSIQVDVSKLLPAIQAKTLVVNNPAAIHPDTAKQLIAGISNAAETNPPKRSRTSAGRPRAGAVNGTAHCSPVGNTPTRSWGPVRGSGWGAWGPWPRRGP